MRARAEQASPKGNPHRFPFDKSCSGKLLFGRIPINATPFQWMEQQLGVGMALTGLVD
jgi:hypothetical protein